MAFELIGKVVTNLGPFAGDHAVHDGVTHCAIATQGMVTNRTVTFGAESFDGALRGIIKVVGAPTYNAGAQRIKRCGR
jgi:hypothetical protein